MTKADFGNSGTKEVMESEPKKEMKEAVMKRRIHQVTFIITVLLAGFVCFLSAQRYFSWMAQTVIDRTDVHISEIPFPAVTLCPLMNVYNLKKELHEKEEPKVRGFLRSLEEVIPSDDDNADFNDQGLLALEYIDDEDILKKISFQCEDFFAECTWRRVKRNCCSLFRIVSQGKKICYAFNSLAVEDPDPTWPWSETLSGRKSGLRVLLKMNASEAMLPKVMTMIHYPEDQFSGNNLFLQGKVHITLDALKFHADPEIRQLRAEHRRCYFSDEINKQQKSTSQCLQNCRTAYMEQVCDCTPRCLLAKGKLNKEYCNSTHLPCIFEHRDAFLSNGNVYGKHLNGDSTEFVDCKCFQNCNYVQYKTFVRYDSDTSNAIENNSLIDLEVNFLRDTIFSYRTAMVYCLLDLIVALCSIIALFLGISFISVIKTIQDHFEKRRIARTLAKAQQNK